MTPRLRNPIAEGSPVAHMTPLPFFGGCNSHPQDTWRSAERQPWTYSRTTPSCGTARRGPTPSWLGQVRRAEWDVGDGERIAPGAVLSSSSGQAFAVEGGTPGARSRPGPAGPVAGGSTGAPQAASADAPTNRSGHQVPATATTGSAVSAGALAACSAFPQGQDEPQWPRGSIEIRSVTIMPRIGRAWAGRPEEHSERQSSHRTRRCKAATTRTTNRNPITTSEAETTPGSTSSRSSSDAARRVDRPRSHVASKPLRPLGGDRRVGRYAA